MILGNKQDAQSMFSQKPFPPRPFCPRCGSEEVRWVDLPKTGEVYAFSQQAKAMRYLTPDVIGLVKLKDVGLVLTRFMAKIDELHIGQPVELEFNRLSERLTLHQFRPIEAKE